jgi:hypothetical protein
MESHLHNSMYVFHMCTFFSSPLGRSAQVVEKGHFVFVYVISTKLLPCFGYLVFCSKIPYSVIRIIIVKFLYKSKLIDLIKIHASLHTQTTWLQVRLPFFFKKKKKKKKNWLERVKSKHNGLWERGQDATSLARDSRILWKERKKINVKRVCTNDRACGTLDTIK